MERNSKENVLLNLMPVKENSKVSFQYIMAFRIKKIFTNFVKNSLRVDQTSEKTFAMLYNSVSKSERRI